MPINLEHLRAAGFSTIESYRNEIALRLLCAFNGVDWQKSPPAWWANPNASSREAWIRVVHEARRIFLDAPPLRRVQHMKRGTRYDVIDADAELQMDRDLVDGAAMVVYRGDGGRFWVRHLDEFEDGRFQDVPRP